MRRFLGLCAAATLAVGGQSVHSTTAGTGSAVYADACAAALRESTTGPVTNPAITEASGIVASRRQPGIYWVHNDSGDGARLYAIDTAGRRRATFVLQGVGAFDWEAIALGPGPIAGVDYLYVGDIGDNFLIRSTIRVLRFREPLVPVAPEIRTITSGVASLRLRYPDRARNAEALMIDPRTGMLYVVTKQVASEGIRVLAARANLAPGSTSTLRSLGTPDLPEGGNPTGVDMSHDGRTIALRTYDDVYVYDVAPTMAVATALLARPCVANAAIEPQGEAIAFHTDDRGFVTFSEGAGQPLNHRDA